MIREQPFTWNSLNLTSILVQAGGKPLKTVYLLEAQHLMLSEMAEKRYQHRILISFDLMINAA